MDLPELPIPELPDEMVPSTSGETKNNVPPQVNTGDYVTSLGRIGPLPEKDLEIPPELLQCDPDITEVEAPKMVVKAPKVNT